MPELTLWWLYCLKSWLFANQYFNGIQYMRRIPSHKIQTVTHSAFHNILSFWLPCHLGDSKTGPYSPRFLEPMQLNKKPFRSVCALKALTGPAIPGHLPKPLPNSTCPRTPLKSPVAVSLLGLWQQEVVLVRNQLAFSSSKWNSFCGGNDYISKGYSFQSEHETCFHKRHGEVTNGLFSLSSSAGTRNQIQIRRWQLTESSCPV